MTANASARAVAQELSDWFESVLALVDRRFSAIAPDGPHREAVILDTLTSNARVVVESEVDREGKLYSPLCFFLSAACRRLGTSVGVGHWHAAVENVLSLGEQMASDVECAELGLEIGGPARLFKQQLDEAIVHSGLAAPSYLDKQDREIALGLAVNWGMRFLLAYAQECGPHLAESCHKDLAWIARQLSR